MAHGWWLIFQGAIFVFCVAVIDPAWALPTHDVDMKGDKHKLHGGRDPVVPTPEPATLLLLGSTLTAVAVYARRYRDRCSKLLSMIEPQCRVN